MIHHIRPWHIFRHLEDHDVLYRIPSHQGTESETIMAVETMLLVAVARIFKVRSILELGTSLGYNALQLARNTDAEIITVDRTKQSRVFDFHERILPIQADIFDLSGYPLDMVFCDINYTEKTLQRSTELAFSCEPKVIAWHDYGHPLLPHTVAFHEAQERHLYHVEDTWLLFWFRDGLEIEESHREEEIQKLLEREHAR